MKTIFTLIKVLVLIALVIGGGIYLINPQFRELVNEQYEKLDELSPQDFPKYGDRSAIPANLQPPKVLPLPRNNQAHIIYTGAANAPLLIVNKDDSLHSLIKIVDAYSGRLMSKHFVHAGESISIKLPDGAFRFKVASGKRWYGEPYLFGPRTILYEMKDPLKYGKNENFVIHTVEINLPIFLTDQSQVIQQSQW